MDVGLVAVILIFSPAVIRTVTKHLEKQKLLKHELIKNELELEKIKHANYLLETEKMRLELEKELKLPDARDLFNHKV